jgi:pimeloyl-ACP methyl ester carboxylesterase
VFEGGLGAPSLMWALVQPGVAQHARACSYDRAGYGWSDPGPESRTARRLAGELRALLQAAGEAPPYVFAGHSLGAIIVRVYAADYPDEVAGLVLVDPRHEDFYTRMPAEYLQVDENNYRNAQVLQAITPIGVTRIAGNLGSLGAFDAYLAPLQGQGADAAWAKMIYNPQHWATAVAERAVIDDSYAEVRATRLPADLPLVVLIAERGDEACCKPASSQPRARATC